jgi:L-aminopeptidase/D-esterase-like protein
LTKPDNGTVKGLTDIPGVRVGHASNFEAITGCTAILFDQPAAGGVDVRGFATGSQELDVLSPYHVTNAVHAVVLAGGSAYGLECASGVRRYLEKQGVGFDTGVARVPIVPAAILFDLGIGSAAIRPDREMGLAAAAAARTEPVLEGSIGAGTGCTVGKLFGMPRAMKSGLGSHTVTLGGGVMVSALVAVNALGDVRDPMTGQIIAGARQSASSREFADSELALRGGKEAFFPGSHNTTLAVVVTNAKLPKTGAHKLAAAGSLGMARTIYPLNTTVDGDITFAFSCGDFAADQNSLGSAAAEAVAQSILRAVRAAKGMGGVPAI